MDTDMLSAIERRTDSLQATDVTDLATLLFEFDGVCHVEPEGHDDAHRDPSLNVLFDSWRDTEAVIEVCRCGGFEVREVVFERGEIRFQPEGA